MAWRQLFTDEQWASLLSPPRDEREIVRHCTLSRDDLDLIAAKRSDHSRLGFAVLLCYLRHPGRALEAGETPPAELLAFIADQLDVDVAAFNRYQQTGSDAPRTARGTGGAVRLPDVRSGLVPALTCLADPDRTDDP
jgi:TnpA family transposase